MSKRTRESIRPIPNKPVAEAKTPEGPDMNPGVEQLRDLVSHTGEVLWRRRKVFQGVAGGLFLLMAMFILLQTPIYESTAQMIVKFGRELVYNPEVGSDAPLVSRDKQAIINSELAILRSRPVLEEVVRTIGVGVLYPDLADDWTEADALPTADETVSVHELLLAEGAERLRGALESQALPDTDVLQVTIQNPDPLIARASVNALIEAFLDAHVNAFSQPEIVKFLAERVVAYESRLAETEGSLQVFQIAHPGFAHEQPQIVLLTGRDQLSTKIDELDTQISSMRLSLMQNDAAVSDAKSQLLQLKVEESQLRGERRAAARERMLVVQSFISERKAELDTELAPLIAKRDKLETRLENTETELAQLPTLSAEHRRLLRERDADEEQYGTYVKRLRDARVSSEMDSERIASVNIIQPASVSPRPVWPPSKPASIVTAAVLAVIVGLLAVSMLDRIGPVGVVWLDGEENDQPVQKEQAVS